MNTKIIAGIVGTAVVAGVAFYGGMTYGKGSQPTRGQLGNGQNFRGEAGGNGMRVAGGGIAQGEIISMDASGITIKMQDGSTKIILVASSTQVMKSAVGSFVDLSNGVNVVVTGSANSDGSMTAQSVQIRPAGSGVSGLVSPAR